MFLFSMTHNQILYNRLGSRKKTRYIFLTLLTPNALHQGAQRLAIHHNGKGLQVQPGMDD